MGGLSIINLSSSVGISSCQRWGNVTTTTFSSQIYQLAVPKFETSSVSFRNGCSRLICYSKPSVFQGLTSSISDFQDYVRPERLLPSTEASILTESSPDDFINLLGGDESRSVYFIKLRTSSFSGSCLSDINAGVMFCLIDENGNSLLQRIAASPKNEECGHNFSCFQRGSSDEFKFDGPKLGKIEAVWIGLESGRWRLGGINLIVINGCLPQSTQAEQEGKLDASCGLQYYFDVEDVHIGDGTDTSMLELRPSTITELSGDISSLTKVGICDSTSIIDREKSNEESMEEYGDLKLSLLLYDFVLIFAGSWIMDISVGERAGLAFLTGGGVGFLYLLLLQRSVDGLSAPSSVSLKRDSENLNELLAGLKAPISGFALAVVVAVVVVKYGSDISPIALTPKEILVGMTGFLVCKVAVVLAAFKPMSTRVK
ncbi:hypothetical protein C5167_001805 [Papaver somniferum]|uniref:DUF7755 domain-containing protein n=1 Tax=Papaver somniferum TaxID=3469 RepID=A0A4Y7L084_PAPSO|nr:hypothetical protein C5167_001805 [Papaver somniferum]